MSTAIHSLGLGAALLVFASCASAPPPEKVSQFRSTIPTCENADDCKAKWEAAQLWVVHNAAYKIQTATDVLIETYNSTDTGIAVRVTKEPLGGGRYQILVTVGCGNPFGCAGNTWDLAINFNRTVGAATP